MKKIGLFILALLSLPAAGLAVVPTVALVLRDTSMLEGETIDFPISVDESLTGKDVFSYTFQLQYDPRYLELDTVMTDGCVSEALGPPTYHETQPDYYLRLLTIAGSGSQPLTGKGVFVRLRFKALAAGWHTVRLTGAKNSYFNEGVPSLSNPSAWCYLQAEAKPSLWVSPQQATLVKGDSIQMEAGYGTSPYHWSVSDTTVARITTSGVLYALNVGMVKVTATDSKAVSGMSGPINVLPYRVRIPENMTQLEGQVVEVPVFVSYLTGLDVVSGSFRIQYDDYYLHYEGYEASNGLLESYNLTVNATVNERLMVAFAGSNPVEGDGLLMKLRFRLLRRCYGTTLSVDHSLFNQSLLGAHTNGSVRSKEIPTVSITPIEGSLAVGESESYHFYGAVGPVQWTVSDTSVARIDHNGVMTALRRGMVTVIGIDTTGVSARSDPFTVVDTRVTLADTGICTYDRAVNYPVFVDRIPEEGLYAYEATLRFDTTRFAFEGIKVDASVTSAWTFVHNLTFSGSYGYIHVASSGTQHLSSPGVLFHAAFKPHEGFNAYTLSTIRMERFIFNEGLPTVAVQKEGSIFGVIPQTTTVLIRALGFIGLHYMKGDTVKLQADVFNVVNPAYQWFVNEVMVPGATQPTFATTTLTSADTVRCRVTVVDECVIDPVAWSNKLNFRIDGTTSVASVSADQLTVFPNPFRERLSVRSALFSDEQAVMLVYDITGKRCNTQMATNGNERIIDFSQQQAGFYVIVVQTPTKMERIKVLKQ